MCLLPQRNPVYTAKEVATVDWLSNGRVDLGVGVGWLREEFEAVDVPWERRGDRTDEYLQVLHALWCDDPSSFSGDALHASGRATSIPNPSRIPHPPIHIGGRERSPPCAASPEPGQGWHTFNRAPADLPDAVTRLEALLAEHGRARREVTVTVCPYFKPLDAPITEQYAEAGADAVSALLFAMSAEDVPAAFEALDPCIERARAC